jgi:glyoxylase-like metal-dependent hydrolase (beta-lactamase superfamily II)
MKISSFYEPDSGTWTHLLADPVEQKAAIIDPVLVYDPVSGQTDTAFIEQVLAEAERAGYSIQWVLETHAHADHLTAAELVKRQSGAKTACGRGICGVQKNFARVFNMEQTPTDGSQFDRLLVEGDGIQLGRLNIEVMDTLFAPAFGTARCDFPGGDAGQLYDSIKKLYQLPGETRLFLCHDYPKEGEKPVKEVTVKQSQQTNIHLKADTTRSEFVAMRTARDSQLGLPRLILPSLQVNILAGATPAAESNGVTYLRTPFNRSIADLIKGE